MKKFTTFFLYATFAINVLAQLPETFDLRNYNGNNYVTAVKSQSGGTCWTHGTMASMESNLLMTGNWVAAGETGEPNLAEYHLDWWNGYNQFYNADLDPPYNNGQGLEVHMGGDYRVSTAYISRGDGAVRDIDGQSYNTAPSFYESTFHKYYPMDVEWYNAGPNLENIDLIKAKVMEHGAMATCMCYSSSFINGEYEHYQPASNSLDPNHSVTIIGWDDNRVVQGAPGDGAWLTKNSWGAGWGNGGYFWISYYDKHACQNPEMGAISFMNVLPMPYDTVYYHDYHGWRDTLTTATEAFNAYVAEENISIEAVSFFAAADFAEYSVVIFDDFDGTELSNPLATNNGGILGYSGLHTLAFDVPAEVAAGDDFYVYLYLSDGGIPYDRTSEVPVLLGGGSKTIVPSAANPGESFYKENDVWKDFYNYNDPSAFQNTGNFCIKALANLGTGTGIDVGGKYQQNTLGQNYPNPFRDGTNILFTTTETSNVEISIRNIVGEEMRTYQYEALQAGHHNERWDGKTSNGGNAGPGIYFYSLKINGKVISTNQMLKLN